MTTFSKEKIIMTNRICIFGDVHGSYIELCQLLNKISPTKDDRLISLGDLTDRGSIENQLQCITLCNNLGIELCASNHDERYCKFYRDGKHPDDVKPNSKSVDSNEIRDLYRALTINPQLMQYLSSRKPFIQFEVAGRQITCLHGGVLPYHSLENLSGKDFNEIIRARWTNPTTGDFVRLVKSTTGKYEPEYAGVVPWQQLYDGRYGLIVHGHNIIGDVPVLWGGISPNVIKLDLPLYSMQAKHTVNDYNVASIDTGCYAGGYLTACIIDANTGYFEFIQVKSN